MVVYCAGMPKAGSTLQYNVCKELLAGEPLTDHGWVEGAKWAEGFRPDPPAGGHAILKCHMLPAWIGEAAVAPDVRILSTYRDLRDVAASAREFQADKDFDYLIATLDLTVQQLGRLDPLENCLIQRYESLMEDLAGAVADVAEYLDRPVTAEQAREIAERWHVDATHDRATRSSKSGFRGLLGRSRRAELEKWDSDTLLWPAHISSKKGRPGRYLGVLAEGEVDLIESRYGDWLRAHSYL